ncbi:hypothetical protein A1D31_08850 [Bradyrhizobium liaoningense]|nr:hypothetical protein A1D31_08850 [Bradyrhizobium liaoningense]
MPGLQEQALRPSERSRARPIESLPPPAVTGAVVAAIDNKRACGSAIDLRANRQKCDCRFGGGHHMMQVMHDSDHA